MVLGDNIAQAGVRFTAKIRELEVAEKSLKRLDRTIRTATGGALALNEATDTLTRSQARLTGSSSTATAGLAGLQMQMVSARAASEALERSTGDLTEAVSMLGDDSSATREMFSQLSEHVVSMDDGLSGLDSWDIDAPDAVMDVLNDFDREQMASFLQFASTDADWDEFDLNVVGLDPTIEQIDELRESLNVIEDDFPSVGDGIIGSLGDIELDKGDVWDVLGDSDLAPADILQMEDAEIEELFADAGMELGDVHEFKREFFGSMDELDHEWLVYEDWANEFDRKFTMKEWLNMPDDEAQALFDEAGLPGADPKGVRESMLRDLEDTFLDGDEPLQSLIDAEMSDVLSDADFTGILGDGPGSISEQLDMMLEGTDIDDMPGVESAFQNIGTLMEDSDAITSLIDEANAVDDAMMLMDGAFREQSNFVEFQNWLSMHGDEISAQLGSLADPDNIQTDAYGSIADMGADVSSELQRAAPGEDEAEELVAELSPAHVEMLSNVMADLDPGMVEGRRGGAELPIAGETLRMGILQEMLDWDTDEEPFQMAEDLLARLEAGQLGVEGTLFDQESDVIATDIGKHLPREMRKAGVADDIVSQFQQDEIPLADFLGPDPQARISHPVSQALQGHDFDDPHAMRRAIEAVDEVLPAMRRRAGARVAPGLESAIPGAEDIGLTDLSRRDAEGPLEYTKRMTKVMDNLRDVQDAAPIQRGLGRPGSRRRMGLFGGIMHGASRALGGLRWRGQRADLPTRMQRIRNGLESMSKAYDDMLPLLEATSIRLGSINVNFESMGIMVFKLTAMLGPLAATLAGIGAGAATAAAGVASFIGVGAVQYLDEMEETMAGVNNRQEAMGELTDTLRTMAWQALEPLRTAQIGGSGRTPMNLFIDILRGALVLLNRFAGAMAHIAELPVVAEQTERLASLIMGTTSDDTFMHQMGEVVENILPLLVSIAEFIITGFGGAMVHASDVAGKLGESVGKFAEDSAGAFGLMILYGAGFMDAMLQVARAIGRIINAVTSAIDALLPFVSWIPRVSDDTAGLAWQLGFLVGVLNILTRTLKFLKKVKKGWLLLIKGITTAYHALNVALTYAKSLKLANAAANIKLAGTYGTLTKAVLVATGAFLGLAGIVIILHDIVALFTDLEPVLFDLENGWHALGAAIGFAASALLLFNSLALAGGAKALGFPALIAGAKTIGAAISGLGIKSALVGLGKVLAGVFAGISLKVAGVVAAIAGAVVLLTDFVYWLVTGESKLASWFSWLEPLEAIYARIADYAERIADAVPSRPSWLRMPEWEDIPGVGEDDDDGDGGSGRRGPRGSGRTPPDEEEDLAESNPFDVRVIDYADDSAYAGGGAETKRRNDTGGGRSPASGTVRVNVENNGYIGERDFGRFVRKEVEEALKRDTRNGL